MLQNCVRQIFNTTLLKDVALKRCSLFFVFVIMLLGSYLNTFYSPPVLDDMHTFVFEPKMYQTDLSYKSLHDFSNTKFGWGRYIPILTFALNHKLFESNIVSFHITNLLIHILVLAGAAFMIVELIKASKSDNGSAPLNSQVGHLVLWIAGLWALNPVQTNCVTYLVQRMASMHAMFYVLSVAMYVRGRRLHLHLNQTRQGVLCYFSCFFAAVGAFLSKEISAMLPVMLIATEMWFFQPDLGSKIWNRIRMAHWSVWVLLGTGSLVCGVYGMRMFQKFAALYGVRDFTMWERLLTESRIVIWYMSLLLYPSPSRMSLEHDITISTSIIHPLSTLVCLVLIACLLWQTILLRKRYPLITYGCIWFFMNLAIESTLLPLELIFEHRLYLPSIGFFISVILIVHSLMKSLLRKYSEREFKSLFQSGLAIILSIFSVLTFMRNETWKTELGLEMDNVKKAPLSSRAHVNLAVAYYRVGDYSESINEAKEAIGLGREGNEDYGVAANTIVSACLAINDEERAIVEGEQLIARLPGKIDGAGIPEFYLNLAKAYLESRQPHRAFQLAMTSWDYLKRFELSGIEYQTNSEHVLRSLRAIVAYSRDEAVDINEDGQVDPGELSDKTWIAKELLSRGERQWARTLLALAVTETPEDSEAQLLLEDIERHDAATQGQGRRWNFFKKYVLHPFSKFNASMAAAFIVCEKRLPFPFTRFGEALLDYAISLKSDSSDAHLLKGWYHFHKNETTEAIVAAERATQLEPDYAKAWLGLGFFLEKANRPGEAIAAFHKMLELYPGYSERAAIVGLVTELKGRQSGNGVSTNKSEHNALQPASS